MMFPVVAYAPTAATKPSIAAHPLNLSASGVMSLSSLGVVNWVVIFIFRILRVQRRRSFLYKYMKLHLQLILALPIFH